MLAEPQVVTVFDTAIASKNLGDDVIMDGVMRGASDALPKSRLVRIASHETLGVAGISLVRHSAFALVGGSNLLSSAMGKYPQWRVGLAQAALIAGKCLLMGVGWRRYEGALSPYTKVLLRTLLSRQHLHSVRDGYTATKLADLGFDNVINTGCPTLWGLPDDPWTPGDEADTHTVVFTLTAYAQHEQRDENMLRALRARFSQLQFWPQGTRDVEYLNGFGALAEGVEVLAPSLPAYDAALSSPCTFVGTRLHGGIRALQHGRRAIILSVDNRAIEMGRDFGLPVCAAEDFDGLCAAIDARRAIRLSLPRDAIARWKGQFQ